MEGKCEMKKIFTAVICIIMILGVSGCGPDPEPHINTGEAGKNENSIQKVESKKKDEEAKKETEKQVKKDAEKQKQVEQAKKEAKAAEEKKKAETPTMGELNALSKAYDYLDYMAFSKSGLVEQLEYEGFSNKEAKYGADHCGADWKEQAAKKAKEYMDYDSFSKQGLIDQLLYEGFTQGQAEHGASAVGY